ncbi:MAG: alpha/beta fold hydrolase [Proteobacteria bacterium]|nr:alpha/beta fold hydrolase [Pseudomonadota bacterium]
MAAVEFTYKEQAVLLGRHSLVGIVTRPPPARQKEEPAIVILNTGIVHRVGHHRMYVSLSRDLAMSGRTVVRFDFAGIGDSKPRKDSTSPLMASLSDIREVLDTLEKSNEVKKFILVGLCSGADHAVLYANTDPRVVGLVLMDPTLPPTLRYYVHYVMQRLKNLRNWMSVATGRSGLMRLASTHLINSVRPQTELEGLNLQNLRFSSHLPQCYRGAAARDVRMLAVFTSVSVRHTYKQQMLDAFPEASAGGKLRLEFFPESDHLFSGEKERFRLRTVIGDWLDSR